MRRRDRSVSSTASMSPRSSAREPPARSPRSPATSPTPKARRLRGLRLGRIARSARCRRHARVAAMPRDAVLRRAATAAARRALARDRRRRIGSSTSTSGSAASLGSPLSSRVAVDGVERRASSHDLHVLLRHRLLRQPGGFEGFVLGLVQRQRTILPSRNVDARALRDLGSMPLAAAAGSTSRRPRRRLPSLDRAPRPQVELVPGRRGPSRERRIPSCPRRRPPQASRTFDQSTSGSSVTVLHDRRRGHGGCTHRCRRTISTFSCDIAYSESPAASRPSARSEYSSTLRILPPSTVMT